MHPGLALLPSVRPSSGFLPVRLCDSPIVAILAALRGILDEIPLDGCAASVVYSGRQLKGIA